MAKVIPIFKGGDSDEVSNYKPITVLPLASKILERLQCCSQGHNLRGRGRDRGHSVRGRGQGRVIRIRGRGRDRGDSVRGRVYYVHTR